MKILKTMKDGGPESRVWGHWLFEAKSVASVALLHFLDGSREAYHTHAFSSVSWVVKGHLWEDFIDGSWTTHGPSLRPVLTPAGCFHRVSSDGDTWVITFRGPWRSTWQEYLPAEDRYITLTHGRKVVA